MAARPPANNTSAAAPAANEPVTAESLGWQLRAALPPLRLHSVSLYDEQANVLWLSEGALGPDEHGLVLDAMEALSNDHSMPCYENGLEDGRVAIFLPVRAPQGDLVGIAMILADLKSVSDGVLERIVSPPVRAIMQKVAMLLRASSKSGNGATEPPAPIQVNVAAVLELTPERKNGSGAAANGKLAAEAPVAAPVVGAAKAGSNSKPAGGAAAGVGAAAAAGSVSAAAVRPAAKGAAADSGAELSPQAVDDILEFELFPDVVASAPVARAAPTAAPAAGYQDSDALAWDEAPTPSRTSPTSAAPASAPVAAPTRGGAASSGVAHVAAPVAGAAGPAGAGAHAAGAHAGAALNAAGAAHAAASAAAGAHAPNAAGSYATGAGPNAAGAHVGAAPNAAGAHAGAAPNAAGAAHAAVGAGAGAHAPNASARTNAGGITAVPVARAAGASDSFAKVSPPTLHSPAPPTLGAAPSLAAAPVLSAAADLLDLDLPQLAAANIPTAAPAAGAVGSAGAEMSYSTGFDGSLDDPFAPPMAVVGAAAVAATVPVAAAAVSQSSAAGNLSTSAKSADALSTTAVSLALPSTTSGAPVVAASAAAVGGVGLANSPAVVASLTSGAAASGAATSHATSTAASAPAGATATAASAAAATSPKSTNATTTTKALSSTGTARALNGASNTGTVPSISVTGTSRSLAFDPSSLILDIQPFSKLRAGGRMRRYEVMPRIPHRDANRAPAAMDSLAMQRLLSWLGSNRSAWNLEPTSFSLNLSISTLEDTRFPQHVASCLKQNGIAPDNLGFEIAEPLCTQHRAQVERFITLCDKLGCFVVIDDFSFDSAVLPLLRSKAVRLVKIDPRLTSVALKDKLSQATVVAIVQAVKVLGIHCAAKRVESQASLQWLTAIGCDLAQGAALSQVLPIESLNMPQAAAAPAVEPAKPA